MPAKSGGSHALASVFSVVLAAAVNGYVSAHSETLRRYSSIIGSAITEGAGIPIHDDIAGIIVVIAIVSFVWGVIYHYARHGDENLGESRF